MSAGAISVATFFGGQHPPEAPEGQRFSGNPWPFSADELN